jgi:hypothetical protein
MFRASAVVLTTLYLAAAAGAATPVPLPNPSFETGTVEDLGGWTVTACEGGQVKLSLVEKPTHEGARALVIEKTNGLGYLLLHNTTPIPIKPGTEYRCALQLRVLQRQFGGKVYFVNEELDAAGKITGVRYSPNHIWLAPYLPEGQWKQMWAQWTSAPTAAAVNLRLAIVGNAATLAVDDLTLVQDPGIVKYPGKVQSSEPPYDEARAQATFARRQPQPASVQMIGGQPQFVIGGKPVAPIIHNGSFWRPTNSKFAGFGKAGLHLQTLAVQLGPQEAENSLWPYPGDLQFAYLDKMLRHIAAADPEAQVILLVRCDLPRQWGLDHPDEVFANEDGSRVVSDGHPARVGTPEKPTEYWPSSYGSPTYQAAVIGALQQIGDWLRTHESGELVVGWFVCGGNDGQFFNNNLGPRTLDYSPGELQGFRLWLREEYGTVAKLREAWGDPQVTFETAPMATGGQWHSAILFHALRGPGRRVVDSVRFDNLAPARAVRRFARTLKAAIGRPTFALTYYPDAIHDGGSNKYAVSELLAGDEIDGATAVQEYGQWRNVGGTGCTNATWGAYRLRGKVHIAEIDYRTYLSSMAGPIYDPEGLGATLTADGFRAQVRRDVAASCARGMGMWFYDMGGIWYDDPPLWEVISEARRMIEWSHRQGAPAPSAQMAVFVDEAAGSVIDPDQFGVLHTATNAARLALNLSGVPYDLYLLRDLANPKLPDYRVIVLLDAFSLSRAELTALKARCRKAGRTLVVCGPPGGASEDHPDPTKAFTDLTGWRSEILPEKTVFTTVRAAPESDPLLRDVPEVLSYGGSAPLPWVVPAEPKLKVLGTFVGAGKPSHVIARPAQGTLMYIAVPGAFTPELLRNLAAEAGIRTLGTPGQATYLGCGVAAVHRITPDAATVRFGAPVDLLDPLTGEVTARRVREWTPTADLLDTGLVYYR